MSNRTLVELNHDFCPRNDQGSLLDWALKMRAYMTSGDKGYLPDGVTFKVRRHHSEPDPMALPSRESFKSDADELYERARAFVIESQNGSVSHLQRHLGIVYNRAARIIESLEADGVVTEPDEHGKRHIHVNFETNT